MLSSLLKSSSPKVVETPVSEEHLPALEVFTQELKRWEKKKNPDKQKLRAWVMGVKEFLEGVGPCPQFQERHQSVVQKVVSRWDFVAAEELKASASKMNFTALMLGKRQDSRPLRKIMRLIAESYPVKQPQLNLRVTSTGESGLDMLKFLFNWYLRDEWNPAYLDISAKKVPVIIVHEADLSMHLPSFRPTGYVAYTWHEAAHVYQVKTIKDPVLRQRFPLASAYLGFGYRLEESACLMPFYQELIYDVCPIEKDAWAAQEAAEKAIRPLL